MTDWKLSRRADRDLVELYLYGAETFGRATALAYLDDLYSCFGRLAQNPRLGRPADATGAGLRRLEHRRHVVFYEIEREDVLIVAIVHERSIRRVTR